MSSAVSTSSEQPHAPACTAELANQLEQDTMQETACQHFQLPRPAEEQSSLLVASSVQSCRPDVATRPLQLQAGRSYIDS